MAKARVTMTCPKCGKEYEWTTIEPNRSLADRWVEWAKTKTDRVCPHCYAEAQREAEEERRKEAVEKATTIANELNLPSLTGTEKQIAWAMTIRDEYIQERVDNKENEHRSALLEVIRQKDSAKWWIDNRMVLASKVEPEAEILVYRTMPTEVLTGIVEKTTTWLKEHEGKPLGMVMKLQVSANRKHLELVNRVLNERNVA